MFSLLQKIVIAVPLLAFVALAAVIAWVNLAPDKEEATTEQTEQSVEAVSNDRTAKEYIKIAWDDWNSGGWDTDSYDQSLTFIAIRSIDSKDMADLGVSKEFSELKKIAGDLNGENVGRLSDEEEMVSVEEFRKKLETIHNAIN